MSKNIAIFLDGTWNNPEHQTNVFSLFEQCEGVDASKLKPSDIPANTEQVNYYDMGVGNGFSRFLGGATGYGLSKNVMQAYEFLCRHYDVVEKDKIFVFGFSRGAYTARSLVGLINTVGLLPKDHLKQPIIKKAWDVYKLNNITKKKSVAKVDPERISREFIMRQGCIIDGVRIKFLGVWDTVGALGIPKFIPRIRWRDYLSMHDTEMCNIVEYAYQALAIDEHREIFRHTPWTQKQEGNKEVEQRWFVGAHADIGGGVRDSKLSNIAFIWMQDKAVCQGLKLFRKKSFDDDLLLEPVHDSYRQFAFGLYRLLISSKPFVRKLKVKLENNNQVDEVIDDSVWKYIEAHPNYAPANVLMKYKPNHIEKA